MAKKLAKFHHKKFRELLKKNKQLMKEKEKEAMDEKNNEESYYPTISEMKEDPDLKLVCEKYNLLDIFGDGRYSQVMRANRKSDDVAVAIKMIALLPDSMWLEVQNEEKQVPYEVGLLLQVCAEPKCPNIVHMLDYIITTSFSFIIMERPESYINLSDFMSDEMGPMKEEQVRGVIRQVVEAVLHCHSRGVFHNDIRPGNILYEPVTGQIKLIDFDSGDVLQENMHYTFPPGKL
ncbi:serine/threonine-protein kinase pim-1-like [Erpetoichthys calabaricus]|uniref:serine/threonine-protein kinase pim-1-like n=1 Tax=Erpetoichthys calabaricus TaxID=27687 RepID=UPI0022349D98|nr:serine/threonine-protein kinase pim-1-like [Erpetoichthys calabaricus]